ncbi:hypothetical protein, partial [Leuconostoc mesenteroides]|uniref:hypothetical protein n=1 Tax=Leuconostoc mesenteroides TaxID=1245 RepID=UPI0023619748
MINRFFIKLFFCVPICAKKQLFYLKNLKRFSVLKNFKNILSGGLRKGAHGCKYGRLQELTEHCKLL